MGTVVRVRIGEDDEVEAAPGVHVRRSGEYERVADRLLPVWLEVTIKRRGEPNLFRRIEIRNGRPELVVMCWRSEPGQREIKPKDMRTLPVDSLVDEVYPAFVMQVDEAKKAIVVGTGDSPEFYASRKFVDQTRRRVTPDFLNSVADVYRANIAYAPTDAVARTFDVSKRQASKYVAAARRSGHLPPTTQGKKQA